MLIVGSCWEKAFFSMHKQWNLPMRRSPADWFCRLISSLNNNEISSSSSPCRARSSLTLLILRFGRKIQVNAFSYTDGFIAFAYRLFICIRHPVSSAPKNCSHCQRKGVPTQMWLLISRYSKIESSAAMFRAHVIILCVFIGLSLSRVYKDRTNDKLGKRWTNVWYHEIR